MKNFKAVTEIIKYYKKFLTKNQIFYKIFFKIYIRAVMRASRLKDSYREEDPPTERSSKIISFEPTL